MLTGTITLWTFETFDASWSDALQLPAGLDPEILGGKLLAECGWLEMTFPDFDFFKNYLSIWCKEHQPAWERANAALEAQYNPIENYDRQEETTDINNVRETTKGQNTAQSRSESQANAFNSPTTASDTGNTVTQSQTGGQGEKAVADSREVKSRIHGNIGVTKAQDMIRAELDIRRQTIYDSIVQEFKSSFCILVY